MRQPIDAVLAVNYRCNARCIMCNIWETQSSDQLTPAEFLALPSTLRTINVSGGEPFLRDDLPDVVAAIRKACPTAKITISTNGFLSDKIERNMREIVRIDPRIALGVSVDGVGEKHDEIRGVPGGFDKATDTLRRLQRLGMKDLRFSFTASSSNIDHLSRVYEITRRLGIEFTCTVAHNSSHYFRVEANTVPDFEKLEGQVETVARSELKTLSPKRWARAYFTSGLCKYATGKGRPLPCEAGSAFFFLSPTGDVYPCNVLDSPMGNIRQASKFADVWGSQGAESARKKVASCRMGCWMVCTARTAILRSLPSVAFWAARSKLKAHLGMPVLDGAQLGGI